MSKKMSDTEIRQMQAERQQRSADAEKRDERLREDARQRQNMRRIFGE